MLEQWGDVSADPNGPPLDPSVGQDFFWWMFLYSTGAFVMWLASLGFWVWMIVHCYRYEADRSFWMWIMLIFPPSSMAYFVARWLPDSRLRMPKALTRLFGGGELQRLEIATLQIGNPHQFVQYGDALREAGQHDKAKAAYVQALERDPANIQALWGAACVDLSSRRFEEAGERLQQVLKIDPQYKFGDVSLAYGQVLIETRSLEDALAHLQKHVQRWRQPEALYLLATLHAEMGQSTEARRTLQMLLLDVASCPSAIARRYGVWKSKAKKMLKKLPA